ncbi:MAG: serine/threonine protein kinase [Polyangiaceae bacterium]|nr:serine/threonine protein kinase [Polyangiaceae bacterium]
MPDPLLATFAAPSDAPEPDGHPLGAGELVGGRYRLERRLGGGGMGEVWRARHEDLGTAVALKFPRGSATAAERDALFERFRFEVQISAQLATRTGLVVAVRDLGLHRALPFAVMDLVVGRSVADALAEDGVLAPADVADLLDDLGEALDAAHGAGIVHRDLKPANVLLPRAEPGDAARARARLTDFGVAKAVGSRLALDRPRDTAAGALVGSPAYMSPEQILGGDVGPASDVWSLGALAYEARTGRLPFDGAPERSGARPSEGAGAAMLVAICGAPPLPLSVARPELPRALDAWLGRALHKRAAERFASAGELARAFRGALAAPRRSRRALGAALVLGALAGTAVVVGASLPSGRAGAGTADPGEQGSAPASSAPAASAPDEPRPPASVGPPASAAPAPPPSTPALGGRAAPGTPVGARPALAATPGAPSTPAVGTAGSPPAPSAPAASPASAAIQPPKPYDPSEEQ